MKTDPNGHVQRTGEGIMAHGGLTKREHFALEMAKARVGNTEMFRKHGAQHHSVAEDAVMWADALIDRLNGILPQARVIPPPKGEDA